MEQESSTSRSIKALSSDLSLTVHDEDDALLDLSGWTARMKIKSGTDQLLVSPTTTPTANGDVLTLGGAAGTVRIFVSTDTPDPLDLVEGRYDIELVDPLSEVDRFLTQEVLRCLGQFGLPGVSVLKHRTLCRPVDVAEDASHGVTRGAALCASLLSATTRMLLMACVISAACDAAFNSHCCAPTGRALMRLDQQR